MNTNAKPPRAPLTTKVTALAARNCAGAKIAGGSMGWLARRSVTTRVAEDSRATTAAAAKGGDRAPRPGRTMIAYVSVASAATPASAPGQSALPDGEVPLDSGTCRHVVHAVTAATGTLIRKIHRQLPVS